MKKILYIQNNCNVGGISTVTSTKANWLVSQGYGVSILFTHYKQIKEVSKRKLLQLLKLFQSVFPFAFPFLFLAIAYACL